MSKLNMSVHGKLRHPGSNAAMVQVGWLGQTGNVYALNSPPTMKQEPASYIGLYMQIGEWRLVVTKKWFGLKTESKWVLDEE